MMSQCTQEPVHSTIALNQCTPPLLQELGDKFAWTVRLHNGLAACQMRMGRWEDAEGELLQVRLA